MLLSLQPFKVGRDLILARYFLLALLLLFSRTLLLRQLGRCLSTRLLHSDSISFHQWLSIKATILALLSLLILLILTIKSLELDIISLLPLFQDKLCLFIMIQAAVHRVIVKVHYIVSLLHRLGLLRRLLLLEMCFFRS